MQENIGFDKQRFSFLFLHNFRVYSLQRGLCFKNFLVVKKGIWE